MNKKKMSGGTEQKGHFSSLRSKTRLAKITIGVILVLFVYLNSTNAGSQPAGNPCTTNSQIFNNPTQQQLCVQNEITSIWAGLMPLAIMAVLFSFTLASLIIIIGIALKSDGIRNFGTGELYEAIATAILVGFFFLISEMVMQTLPGMFISNIATSAGGSSVTITDPYSTAVIDLSSTINTIQSDYDCMYNANNCPSTCSNAGCLNDGYGFGNGFVTLAAGITLTASASYDTETEDGNVTTGGSWLTPLITGAKLPAIFYGYFPLVSMGSFLIDALFVLWGEFYLVYLFSFLGPVFVISGIILRAIFPTRALGGMLISVGIGFYVVAPSLIAFFYSANPYTSGYVLSNMCNGGTGAPNYCGFQGLNVITSIIGDIWLQILFYPILVIAITYTFITQLANFIGASTQMSGRLRVGFI
ncbi:MAG: hypothetical protein M1504_01060 [Candidatus Marsarchaeota archaeon]|nr:hypothetical protein [Candidatus Marsarchaeota archaeon]